MITIKEIEVIVQNMKGTDEEKKELLAKIEVCRDFQLYLEKRLGLSEEATSILSSVYVEEHKSEMEEAFKKIEAKSKDQLVEALVDITAQTMRGFAEKHEYPRAEEFTAVIKGFIRAKVLEEVGKALQAGA